ncbi:hypothetical protein AB0P21_09780 [Kribbella sp. NPDC056861]|uniref:hypothetical protein n=1 Tax=Kribbella sp. NPDC056861 TaxID=3154857 RepID=UPI00341A9B57
MTSWTQVTYARHSWQEVADQVPTWQALKDNPGEPTAITLYAEPRPGSGGVLLEAFAPFRFNWATITRTAPGGVAEPIRDGVNVALNDGGWIGFDYEAPLGVPLTYTATFTRTGDPETVVAASPAVVLDAGGYGRAWLSNAVDPASAVLAWVEGLDEIERPAEVGVFDMVGRSLPVVVTGTRGSRRGQLRLVTATLDERDALWGLLDDGDVLLLRTTREFGIGNLYFAVQKATESRATRLGMHPARRFGLEFVETSAPIGRLVSGRDNTWRQVVTGAATWQDVKDQRADWLDVYRTPFAVG